LLVKNQIQSQYGKWVKIGCLGYKKDVGYFDANSSQLIPLIYNKLNLW